MLCLQSQCSQHKTVTTTPGTCYQVWVKNSTSVLQNVQGLCHVRGSCEGKLSPFQPRQNERVMNTQTLEYAGNDRTAIEYVGNGSNLHSASSLSSQTMQSGIRRISQASSALWDVLTDVLTFPWGRNNKVSYLWNDLIASQWISAAWLNYISAKPW